MENLNNNNNSNSNNNYSNNSKKIRICPVCKQEVLIISGMHNWKNLFRKPTFEEIITLFILIGVIVIYFVYQHDIKQYQNYINNNCKDNSIKSLELNNITNITNITNVTYVYDINQNESLNV